MARSSGEEVELAGIDQLDLPLEPSASRVALLWSALWPKLAAFALFVAVWQAVVWSGWKPQYILPSPATVFGRLGADISDGSLISATAITLRRAAVGYGVSLVIGVALGLAVARSRVLRAATGSLITGLQTMPSIAWFPLAILLFKLSEQAILCVIILGAAPAIANGLIHGVDHVPPLLLRAGRVLGARGLASYRHVILPAALPGFVGGLKQGWAFAWRSLMAGELLVIIANRPSIGVRLQFARELSDSEGLIAVMLLVLVIGIVVDIALFGRLDRMVRRRWGLVDTAP
ncbi:MAG TPA: ABC transporter permease [Actinomycetota bacterium]|nr:ABC transporter permease [Actinomycetota bacterium]